MNSAYRSITLEWLHKAESDFLFAEASLRELSGFYSQICVLCHDSAEKYLKSFIIYNGSRPDRTHDLFVLVNECSTFNNDMVRLNEACSVLNDFYTPLKYPSHYPEISREQAEEALSAARSIKDAVEGMLYETDTTRSCT